MAASMESYVIAAAGCAADCQGLVQKFTTSTPPNFSFRSFTEKWRSMNFELILSCRPAVEAAFVTQELLTIIKNLLIGEGFPLESRIGYMFTLYSLYYKQKFKKKIRLTLDEYCELFKIVLLFKEQSFKEAEFAFFKLFFDNAFHFCATSHEYTFLHRQNSYLEDEAENKDFVPDVHSLLVECDGLSKDSLGELDLLHSKYEELKRNFPSAVGTHSISASNENFIAELHKDVEATRLKYDQYKNARPSSRGSLSASIADDDHGAQRRRLRSGALRTQTDSRALSSSSGRSRGRPRRK